MNTDIMGGTMLTTPRRPYKEDQTRYHLSAKPSANRKLSSPGSPPIYSSGTTFNTCPTSCEYKVDPHKVGQTFCYARLGYYTRKQHERTTLDLDQFTARLRQLPTGSTVRLNVVGDLAHTHGQISRPHLRAIMDALRATGSKAFGYTATRPTAHNLATLDEVSDAIAARFSCIDPGRLAHADSQGAVGAILIPIAFAEGMLRHKRNTLRAAGWRRPVRLCEHYISQTPCSECTLCFSTKDNAPHIALPPHGRRSAALNAHAAQLWAASPVHLSVRQGA